MKACRPRNERAASRNDIGVQDEFRPANVSRRPRRFFGAKLRFPIGGMLARQLELPVLSQSLALTSILNLTMSRMFLLQALTLCRHTFRGGRAADHGTVNAVSGFARLCSTLRAYTKAGLRKSDGFSYILSSDPVRLSNTHVSYPVKRWRLQ